MKKAFDQTVREIKREVNKKVLKVPGVEQKVLDATSNEPWGPHGTTLAEIAQASRNYHEYQMIMQVIWKRLNDIGKNWRHVYKGLTVLEYLVAHGSERVIDEIREHAYQISTLSDFQYIDSKGRDQGSNVRKKSQNLVVLVNDKERIQEVREKAAANRDKFRNTSMGGMYRPGSGGYGYDDNRYGGRNDDRDGYGREREWGDDRYGRDGNRHSRDSDERYARDDDYRGRSQSVDGYRYSSRSRSSDRERDQGFEDDSQYSSSVRGKGFERKFSEPNLTAPPSYEEVVGEARSPVHIERGNEIPAATAPKIPAPVSTSPSPSQRDITSGASSAPTSISPPPASFPAPASAPVNKETDSFDEFDPRSSYAEAPTTSGKAEMDLLGSLSDSFSSNPLAIVPVASTTTASEADTSVHYSTGTTFAASPSASQAFDDPFGDGPFRATTTTNATSYLSQYTAPTSSFVASSVPPQPTNPYGQVPHTTTESFASQDFSSSNKNIDILADIFTPSGISPGQHELQTQFPPQTFLQNNNFVAQSGFPGQPEAVPDFSGQSNSVTPTGFAGPTPLPSQQTGNYYGNYLQQQQAHATPRMVSQQYNNTNFTPQTTMSRGSFNSTPPSSTALALVPQPTKDNKFETKSTVWADTLSRGLVNLNISGSKTNPLADIGVDFDAINRREKRMEKPTTSAVTSTIAMGKAMGSGSGIGRAGAGALRPQMGMNQPNIGMNMGVNTNMNPNIGMNMGMNTNMNPNMGMGRGMPMQPMGFPRGYNMPGGYNSTYTQQPYGGGYR